MTILDQKTFSGKIFFTLETILRHLALGLCFIEGRDILDADFEKSKKNHSLKTMLLRGYLGGSMLQSSIEVLRFRVRRNNIVSRRKNLLAQESNKVQGRKGLLKSASFSFSNFSVLPSIYSFYNNK